MLAFVREQDWHIVADELNDSRRSTDVKATNVQTAVLQARYGEPLDAVVNGKKACKDVNSRNVKLEIDYKRMASTRANVMNAILTLSSQGFIQKTRAVPSSSLSSSPSMFASATTRSSKTSVNSSKPDRVNILHTRLKACIVTLVFRFTGG